MNNEIKIKQDILEALNVKISNNLENRLNVNIIERPWFSTLTTIKNPVQVEIIKNPNNDFLFYESKDLSFTWKSLLSIWITWILYWTYNIKISSLFWINIQDSQNHISWIIWIIIIIEIIIFSSLFFRDYLKNKTSEISKIIWNKHSLKNLYKDLKINKNNPSIKDAIENLENENNKIILQSFQKNIIYYWFKIIYPLYIWIIWVLSIWFHNIRKTLEIIPIHYIFTPIIIFILLIIIVNIFSNFNKIKFKIINIFN